MIISILAGDTYEFYRLIRPYERRVYILALVLLKCEDDAENLTQEIFLKALRNLVSFRSETKFSAWLVNIALTEAHNRLPLKNNTAVDSPERSPRDRGDLSPAFLRGWRQILPDAVAQDEVRLILQQAIHRVPTACRDVFLLRDVAGLRVNEIARALSISKSSVKSRLSRARTMLQRQLAPQLRQVSPRRKWFPW